MLIIDSVTVFLTWFTSSVSLSDTDKITTFMSQVYAFDPAFYDYKFASLRNHDRNPNDYILTLFTSFPSLQNNFIVTHNALMTNIERGITSLTEKFPDFVIDMPFHVCHSLGECDGGTRVLAGVNSMILGLDVMARVHTFANEIPFMQHELFHMYHQQLYKPSNDIPLNEDSLYNGLWLEGLATFISHYLNPDASYSELLLEIPANLMADTDKILPVVCRDLLNNLYSSNSSYYEKFFLFSSTFSYPKRCGYYIGYLLVKSIAEYTPLEKMIRFSEEDFIPLLENHLRHLAAI